MVIMTHTVVDPRTMMIHFQHAPSTLATVMCSRCLVALACVTKLEISNILRLGRLPLCRYVAWSFIDGTQEVIQRKATESEEYSRVEQASNRFSRRPPHVAAVDSHK
jgi:hypothetical protein